MEILYAGFDEDYSRTRVRVRAKKRNEWGERAASSNLTFGQLESEELSGGGAKDSRQKGQVEAYEGNVAGKWLPDRSKQWTAANPPILSDQSDSFGAGGCTNEPIN